MKKIELIMAVLELSRENYVTEGERQTGAPAFLLSESDKMMTHIILKEAPSSVVDSLINSMGDKVRNVMYGAIIGMAKPGHVRTFTKKEKDEESFTEQEKDTLERIMSQFNNGRDN